MKHISSTSRLAMLLLSIVSLLVAPTHAFRVLKTSSLNPCSAGSALTASLFNVVFTPDNRTVSYDIVGVSSIVGNVTAKVEVIAYGYPAVTQTVNPCDQKITQLCPMQHGNIDIHSNFNNISTDIISKVPAIAFSIPDLDGKVRVYISSNNQGQTPVVLACVEASLSNGKTVNQKGVAWVTGIIAGMGLVASAVTSGMGYTNTAAHVAANAMSLFGYFQMQVFLGMCAVDLPPIAEAWVQNFNWSMGVIRLKFMQTIFSWYIAATGGTPSNLLSTLSITSVEVQKRSLDDGGIFKRALHEIVRRATAKEVAPVTIVSGIERVAFRAGIEATNLYITGLTFFIIFVVLVALCVSGFKAYCSIAIKKGWMREDRFMDFRQGWKVVLKGIMYRVVVIGYPQMCVLCLWELTVRDSPAVVVLALFFFFSMTGLLVWASYKVITIAKRSIALHQNPAHILYSNPSDLNRWGFLYVQFRAEAYYFVVPFLAYILLKAIFIAFCQHAKVAQAIGLLLIEIAWLAGIAKMRPWMDKRTNSFNIAIASINLVNVVALLIWTGIFRAPGIVIGVVGVVFFVLNAVFALVLLILLLVASIMAVTSKNPDTRYQPMRDDRASFIKSQSEVNNDLDALGAVSRGDFATEKTAQVEDDDSVLSHHIIDSYAAEPQQQHAPASVDAVAAAAAATAYRANRNQDPHANQNPYAPSGQTGYAYGAHADNRSDSRSTSRSNRPDYGYDNRNYDNRNYGNQSRERPMRPQMYQGYNDSSRPGSDLPLLAHGQRAASASPRPPQQQQYQQQQYNQRRPAQNVPQWHAGAGYD